MDQKDIDRIQAARDVLRSAWDKLHDTRNGFGVYSDSSTFRHKALQRESELAETLIKAEALARDLGCE